jgi:hypothetical protein
MREIEIRATMQLLLRDKKKVSEFYDLTDLHFRNIYIQTVNTSFDSTEAASFLNEID